MFARERSAVRLSLISTDGEAESISLLAASETDLAVARGDLEMPTDAESVAILRKNVVVLWAPSGLPVKGSKKPPVPKIKSLEDLPGHRVGIIGRTQANVTLFRVILTESGIAPEKVKVVQFGRNQIARDGARSDDCCVYGGWSSRQQNYNRCDSRHCSRSRRTQVSSDRFVGNDCSETTALRIRGDSRKYF